MKKSSAPSRLDKTLGSGSYTVSLRTGKIKATKSSASAIRKTLGITASEAKVAAKVVRATRSAGKAKSRGASKVDRPRGAKRSPGGLSKKR